MRALKVPCARCKTHFDFELYAGLCPHCGLAHQAPGDAYFEKVKAEKNDIQKTANIHEWDSAAAEYARHEVLDKLRGVDHYDHHDTKSDPHEAQMIRDVNSQKQKKASGAGAAAGTGLSARERYAKELKAEKKPKGNGLAVLLVLIIILLMTIIYYAEKVQVMLSDHYIGSEASIMQANVEEEIEAGDFKYTVYNAYVLSDPEIAMAYDGTELPAHTKLAAIGMWIEYTGDPVESLDDRYLPYIFDGDRYIEPASHAVYSGTAKQSGLEDYTIDGYGLYRGDGAIEGYLYFLVDENCDMVTVCMEGRKNGFLQSVYEVTLPLEDYRGLD